MHPTGTRTGLAAANGLRYLLDMVIMATANRLPHGWREGHSGDVACPHRDCSCCPDCAKRPEVTAVYGQHFWDPTGEVRRTLEAA